MIMHHEAEGERVGRGVYLYRAPATGIRRGIYRDLPALPGLVTCGTTLDEARAMAVDAIRGHVECLREDGEPIPESDPVPALPVEH